jgi:NAD(P)-dependent dehydrogenase (short-subunit alcohol dehydrogenase family)
MNRFDGKSVLVTGGTSGIGLAAARAFAAEGARVIVTGRDAHGLDEARAAIGSRGLTVRNDVSRLEDARALAETLKAHDVRLDAAFFNAGITRFSAFSDTTEELWDATFNTNVQGTYFQIQP